MPISSNRSHLIVLLAAVAAATLACQESPLQKPEPKSLTVRDVPAVRLNYKYEADVPPPADIPVRKPEERSSSVQSDFDNNRPEELLDQTLASPDQKHVLAVYHRLTDAGSEYRLDMYTPDGKLLRKMTSDTMAVYFPETIVWSPDSSTVAFVAMARAGLGATIGSPTPGSAVKPTEPAKTEPTVEQDANTETAAETPAQPREPTPEAPTGILTFRTQQIYISSADGTGVKPVTVNEGLIYFYYTWSPDSSMLAALATTSREWRYQEIVAESKKELMVPQGRLRIIEKNGRERRLDDALTAVHPVWSPDSTKVAIGFASQVRIYDAAGTNPTQAAVPLRNELLISSQAYDLQVQRQAQEANIETENRPAATPAQPLSMLPDEKSLVSYNPIVQLSWAKDDLIYLETAYLKQMKNQADNVTSFARWHRLALTPQPPAPVR
jgi:hypothetical protein